VPDRVSHVVSVLALVLFCKFLLSDRIPTIAYFTLLDEW